jgi:hypothetical protein
MSSTVIGTDRPNAPSCTNCGGVGWLEVRQPPARGVAPGTPTLMPCRWCRPGQTDRWAGGHLHPDHNRKACERCRDADQGTVGFSTENHVLHQ